MPILDTENEAKSESFGAISIPRWTPGGKEGIFDGGLFSLKRLTLAKSVKNQIGEFGQNYYNFIL